MAEAIRQTAHRFDGPDLSIAVTGMPIVRDATSRAVLDQLGWTVPAIVLVLAGLLALAFRSWRGVWLPLLTISLALLWTMATLSASGRPLNLITRLVPPLLATMGLAYCAHVLTDFEALLREPRIRDRSKRIEHLLRDVTGPVVLTGFTTGVGVLALVTNDLPAIRDDSALRVTDEAAMIVLENDQTGAQTETHQKRIDAEVIAEPGRNAHEFCVALVDSKTSVHCN
mgnify:CR=1 FL=1